MITEWVLAQFPFRSKSQYLSLQSCSRSRSRSLFLEPSVPGAYQVAGFSQGKYTIERDASGKAFVQHARPADAPDPRSTSGTQSARATETVTLEQFLDSVLPNE